MQVKAENKRKIKGNEENEVSRGASANSEVFFVRL